MHARSPVFVAVAFAAACTKSEPSPETAPSASVAPVASAAANVAASPSASAVPSAPAVPSEATSAADSATAAKPTATGAPGPAAKDAGAATASGDAGAPECGTRPLPDCPLQAWMKSNCNPPVMTSDTAKLAVCLDKIVAFAPAGYTNWASIARDGATAARGGDLTAAKAACRSCHDQYKQKYKTEMRPRKIGAG